MDRERPASPGGSGGRVKATGKRAVRWTGAVSRKIIRIPVVAHVVAAVERFTRRLGTQFAAGVAFYSVLSIVPVVMFAVAILGMTLTVFRPDLLHSANEYLMQMLSAADSDDGLAKGIHDSIQGGLYNWRGLLITGFIAAVYAGTRWVLHLKKAVRVMWWDRFGDAARAKNFLVDTVWNFIIFLGLLALLLVAFGITSLGGTFSQNVLSWLGWQDLAGGKVLLRLASIGLVLIASWLLIAFLLIVLPGKRTTPLTYFVATGVGALALTLLQQAAGLIIQMLSRNLSATIFGSVITVMYMFFLIGSIILLLSAWIGTADDWPQWLERRELAAENMAPQEDDISDRVIDDDDDADGAAGRAQESRLDELRRERWAAWKPMDSLRASNYDPEAPPILTGGRPVPQDVAARGVRTGLRLGWGVGAATGMGVGAVVAAVVGRLTRRKQR